jgi:hypothetical protein
MKTFVIAVSFLLLLAATGYCQEGRTSGENAHTDAAAAAAAASRAAQEQRNQKELDAQYRAALDRNKAPAAKTDPWGSVRSSNSAAPKSQ